MLPWWLMFYIPTEMKYEANMVPLEYKIMRGFPVDIETWLRPGPIKGEQARVI